MQLKAIFAAIFLILLGVTNSISAKESTISNYATGNKKSGDRKTHQRKTDKSAYNAKALSAFISAVTTSTGTIDSDTLVKSFQIKSKIDISYDSTTGVFTSHAGPGYYEIVFGGAWQNNASAFALYVDGLLCGPGGNLSSSVVSEVTDWVCESIIIQSHAARPTFAVGAIYDPITLFSGTVGGTTAFITIKKIHNN